MDEMARRDRAAETDIEHLPAETLGPADGGDSAAGPFDGDLRRKLVLVAVALVVALVSFFPIGDFASSPDTHAASIAALDQKKDTVMGLVGGSTGASAAITLLPGDAGTPIAEKLVDLSSDFLIVIAAIYLEKYLLTTLCFVAFKVLVPVACVLFAVSVMLRGRMGLRKALFGIAAKLALFGLAIAFVVPASLWVSGMIEATYQTSIDETMAAAQQTADQVAAEQEAQEEAEAEEAQTGTPLDLLKPIQDAAANVTGAAGEAVETAKHALNGFIEALAVMIVTSCIIPILVLVFFLWLVKTLLGVNIEVPMQMLRPRVMRKIR